jgi:hypothetical protein
VKLGKKPAKKDRRDLLFYDYLTNKLPTHPEQFGHESLVSSWGMLGNDSVGDCVFAGAGHETMLWTTEGGAPAVFTDKCIISDYSAVTGYNPNESNSDQGTDVREALKYRSNTGLIDALGNRHKIGAFVSVDYHNIDEIKEAIFLFNAIGIGIQFPASAMEQFSTGKPWTVVENSSVEGGHYVPCLGYDADYIYCVTWGKVQKMDYNFFKTYCDEAFAILSVEMLKADKSPDGFDIDQLQADLKAL